MKTVFEKIIDREIAADIVYEDDICLAFLDIAPVKKGHTLLVSKRPYPWVEQVPDDELSHMMIISKQLIQGMKSHIAADYVQITIVGTEVPHFHIHLIPHKKSDPVITSHERVVDNYQDDTQRQEYCELVSRFKSVI